jgi:hypothetical protein
VGRAQDHGLVTKRVTGRGDGAHGAVAEQVE